MILEYSKKQCLYEKEKRKRNQGLVLFHQKRFRIPYGKPRRLFLEIKRKLRVKIPELNGNYVVQMCSKSLN